MAATKAFDLQDELDRLTRAYDRAPDDPDLGDSIRENVLDRFADLTDERADDIIRLIWQWGADTRRDPTMSADEAIALVRDMDRTTRANRTMGTWRSCMRWRAEHRRDLEVIVNGPMPATCYVGRADDAPTAEPERALVLPDETCIDGRRICGILARVPADAEIALDVRHVKGFDSGRCKGCQRLRGTAGRIKDWSVCVHCNRAHKPDRTVFYGLTISWRTNVSRGSIKLAGQPWGNVCPEYAADVERIASMLRDSLATPASEEPAIQPVSAMGRTCAIKPAQRAALLAELQARAA